MARLSVPLVRLLPLRCAGCQLSQDELPVLGWPPQPVPMGNASSGVPNLKHSRPEI